MCSNIGCSTEMPGFVTKVGFDAALIKYIGGIDPFIRPVGDPWHSWFPFNKVLLCAVRVDAVVFDTLDFENVSSV